MIAKTINNKISLDELYLMVGNPEVKDGELQDFFILDPRSSNSFQPRIIPNQERVDLGQEATSIDFQATLVDIGIALANAIARERRHWQYLLTIKLPNRQKIVTEFLAISFVAEADVVDDLFQQTLSTSSQSFNYFSWSRFGRRSRKTQQSLTNVGLYQIRLLDPRFRLSILFFVGLTHSAVILNERKAFSCGWEILRYRSG